VSAFQRPSRILFRSSSQGVVNQSEPDAKREESPNPNPNESDIKRAELIESDLLASGIHSQSTTSLPKRNAYLIGFHLLISCILLVSSLDFFGQLLQTGKYLTALVSGIYYFFSLSMFSFALKTLIGSIYNLYRPTQSLMDNHRFYGAVPKATLHPEQWPGVTIQIPVYKENFVDVIQPTLESALKAARGYANVVVYDDGLMVLAQDDLVGAEARIVDKQARNLNFTEVETEIITRLSFYRQHQISFIARSKDNRAGLFKKGSNLNFGMDLADQLEARLKSRLSGHDLTPDNLSVYQEELNILLAEQKLPASAEGDIRLGEFMVLLDKDSYMPEGIIERTLPEFLADDQLAFTQHRTKPINGDENYFANLLGRFTENLYFLWINVATLDGDFPPFVGHNAFLRKAAMRRAKVSKGEVDRYWNEKVSEDFELSMRLQAQGYHGKYVVFPGFDFGEGVSRTFSEESAKLKKFAFGAMELAFNPLGDMLEKGIFTDTFKGFWTSPTTPLSAKISIFIYLSSYLAMASAYLQLLSQMILEVTGMVSWQVVEVPITSFSVMLLCLFVFMLVSSTSNFLLRNEMSALSLGIETGGARVEFWREVRCAFFTMLLFNGLLWSVFQGAVLYLFSCRPNFGATNMDKLKQRNLGALIVTIVQEHAGQIVVAIAMLCFFGFAHMLGSWRASWFWSGGYVVAGVLQLIAPFLLNPLFLEKFAGIFRITIARNGLFTDHQPFFAGFSEDAAAPSTRPQRLIPPQPYGFSAIGGLALAFAWAAFGLVLLSQYVNSFSGTCTWPILCTWIYRLEDQYGLSEVSSGPALIALISVAWVAAFLTQTSRVNDFFTKLVLLLGWVMVLVVPSLFISQLGSPQVIALALLWLGTALLSIGTKTGANIPLALASITLVIAFGTSYLPMLCYFLVPLYVVKTSLEQQPYKTRKAFSAFMAPFVAMLGTIFSLLF
jgi:cellulose synthase/poly-beta-1,6-N-acetylglucosamine synthase-like glycosyltransferase